MYRNAIEKLKLWKEDIERKPLILKGARQVGKTYLLKEFAKNYYKNFVYINFDTEDEWKVNYFINEANNVQPNIFILENEKS